MIQMSTEKRYANLGNNYKYLPTTIWYPSSINVNRNINISYYWSLTKSSIVILIYWWIMYKVIVVSQNNSNEVIVIWYLNLNYVLGKIVFKNCPVNSVLNQYTCFLYSEENVRSGFTYGKAIVVYWNVLGKIHNFKNGRFTRVFLCVYTAF